MPRLRTCCLRYLLLRSVIFLAVVGFFLSGLVKPPRTMQSSSSINQIKVEDDLKMVTNSKATKSAVKGKMIDAAVSSEQLTLVSMNVAGCIPSKEAPRGWDEAIATKAIRDEILRTDPDVLALQECPINVVTQVAAIFPDYTAVGVTHSHADYVLLLVRKGIKASHVPMPRTKHRDNKIPAVMAKLSLGNCEVYVASVHLAPFAEGRAQRQEQMNALIELAESTFFIVAGDTNMRDAEDDTMEKWLRLVDFWKLAGSDVATKWTWDTLDHGTHFNCYYGHSTRQYHARYDRIYATQPQSPKAPKLSVLSFELIGNRPVTNNLHFLSDHFGISTRFALDWCENDNGH